MKMTQIKIKQTKTFSMSPQAIDARLKELEELYQLSMSLIQAKWIGSLKEIKNKQEKK